MAHQQAAWNSLSPAEQQRQWQAAQWHGYQAGAAAHQRWQKSQMGQQGQWSSWGGGSQVANKSGAGAGAAWQGGQPPTQPGQWPDNQSSAEVFRIFDYTETKEASGVIFKATVRVPAARVHLVAGGNTLTSITEKTGVQIKPLDLNASFQDFLISSRERTNIDNALAVVSDIVKGSKAVADALANAGPSTPTNTSTKIPACPPKNDPPVPPVPTSGTSQRKKRFDTGAETPVTPSAVQDKPPPPAVYDKPPQPASAMADSSSPSRNTVIRSGDTVGNKRRLEDHDDNSREREVRQRRPSIDSNDDRRRRGGDSEHESRRRDDRNRSSPRSSKDNRFSDRDRISRSSRDSRESRDSRDSRDRERDRDREYWDRERERDRDRERERERDYDRDHDRRRSSDLPNGRSTERHSPSKISLSTQRSPSKSSGSISDGDPAKSEVKDESPLNVHCKDEGLERLRLDALKEVDVRQKRLEKKHLKERRLLTAAAKVLGGDDVHLQQLLQVSLADNLKKIQTSFMDLLVHSRMVVQQNFEAKRKNYLRQRDLA